MTEVAGYVRVLAFGPIAESIGSRTSKVEWHHGMSIEDIVHALDMQHWIGQGLAVALNGERCPLDIHPQQGDEVALLPPVSGG
ncbi:MAG: MoaD/ThiS family protein [Euryarchaeota archaeon]|jgi:molybdopterin converting factor small subunit|nr:MoaD/ThiS family protein [Euryarchaeota archaeon]